MKLIHTERKSLDLLAHLTPCKSRHAEPGEKTVAFSLLSIKAYRNEKALRLLNLQFGIGNSRGLFGIWNSFGDLGFELLWLKVTIG